MLVRALRQVFRKPAYALLAFAVGATVFAFAVWLPNIPLIVQVMGHPGVPLIQKLELPVSLLRSIATNFTPFSASYTVAIAVLFGVDFAMIVYFLRRRVDDATHGGVAAGFFGIASGAIGMGCASCGSFLLTSTLSFFGAAGILAALPLQGGEFGIFGVILLGASLVVTARQIQNPAVCRTTN